MSIQVPEKPLDPLRQRIYEDTPYWAENFVWIIDKKGRRIPFVFKPGQAALDAELEAQRAAGKPMRAYVLKARQIGFSTSIQGKIVHRATLRERYDAVAVAQDKDTGQKLFRMAQTMYVNLPDDAELKPKIGEHRRGQFLHFAGEGDWMRGESFPDSRYQVDTAGEFQSGRGGTYRAVHASEAAFWPRLDEKLTSLMSAVPDDPDTLFAIESTANGFNEFKDRWDDAWEGRTDWIAFFWPWWKEEEYARPFASPAERERFLVGDPNDPYAEEEPDLVAHFELSLEQLNWRRYVIANKGGGDIRYFHQEYPSTPEEAFISTGQKVFDAYRTKALMVRVERTDPRQPTEEHPGPRIGDLRAGETRTDPSRNGGTIEVPTQTLWTPRMRGVANPTAPWRFWLKEDGRGGLQRPSEYVIGVDVSGGKTETTDEPDYHAIEVIDHVTLEQVAEYRSRIDVDLFTRQVLLAALYFNSAYVAVERTGGYGLPVVRILWQDLHYPHLYRSKRVGNMSEGTEKRLGWDTNVRTKPDLIAHMAELLRDEVDGIRSRALANELRTYTRTEKGTAEAEPKKYDDLLIAYMIAQQVAKELPRKGTTGAARPGPPAIASFGPGAGISGYDPRRR